MKERPILFTPENVRKVDVGDKDQTRRVLKWPLQSKSDGVKRRIFLEKDVEEVRKYIADRQRDPLRILCPYGQVGDCLWVKEGWGIGGARLVDPTINYRAGGQLPLIGHSSPDTWSLHCNRHEVNDADLLAVKEGWHSGLFMPKWAARLWLEIIAVRIQQVQEISEEDAMAEGIIKLPASGRFVVVKGAQYFGNAHSTARAAFQALWDSINGKKHPWDSNPWVWCLTFRRVQ